MDAFSNGRIIHWEKFKRLIKYLFVVAFEDSNGLNKTYGVASEGYLGLKATAEQFAEEFQDLDLMQHSTQRVFER